MALETAFELLQQRLHDLQTTLDELEVFITDKPERGGDVIVVGQLNDAVDDVRGWLDQMQHAIGTNQQAAGQPLSSEQARRSMMTCQESFNRMLEQSAKTGLLSFESMSALMDLGGRRGGEWAEWANIVRQAIEHCRHATHRVSEALYTGWRELTGQQLGRSLVSVQTTNVGQQIAMSEGRKVANEPIS